MALSEAAVLWPGRPIDFVVSLGCGEPLTRVNNPTGVMAWVKNVVELAMSSVMAHKVAAALLGERYFRLDADSGEGDVVLSEHRKVRTCCRTAWLRVHVNVCACVCVCCAFPAVATTWLCVMNVSAGVPADVLFVCLICRKCSTR